MSPNGSSNACQINLKENFMPLMIAGQDSEMWGSLGQTSLNGVLPIQQCWLEDRKRVSFRYSPITLPLFRKIGPPVAQNVAKKSPRTLHLPTSTSQVLGLQCVLAVPPGLQSHLPPFPCETYHPIYFLSRIKTYKFMLCLPFLHQGLDFSLESWTGSTNVEFTPKQLETTCDFRPVTVNTHCQPDGSRFTKREPSRTLVRDCLG